MSSYIDMYFEQFKHRLTDKHKQDITNMYDNIHVYNYDEVFGPSDLSFNTSNITIFRHYSTVLNPKKMGFIKGTVISPETNDIIYKLHICQNDENKDLFIINFLREVYFQNTFRDILTKEGVTSIIIPEIYRHGLIYNNETNDVLIFMEMRMYDFNECFALTVMDMMSTYKAKVETLHTHAVKCYNNRCIFSDLEKKYGLYHNDNVSSEELDLYIHNLLIPLSYNSPPETNDEDVENKCKEYIMNAFDEFNAIFSDNFFSSVNKTILIDFEDASVNPFDHDLGYHRNYIPTIVNNLIFSKGI